MKIYYKNRAAKLKNSMRSHSCKRCPFNSEYLSVCVWGTSTMIDCNGKGWWIDGESIDIFNL